MAVGQYHAAIQSGVPGAARGHDLQLGGDEVLLLHAPVPLQNGQYGPLHRVLLLFLFAAALGLAADQYVQRLAVHELRCGLLHLLLGQVGQQVGDAEHRVVVALADRHLHGVAVPLHDHAVQRQGQRQPLVLLDAAVVVGIQVGQVPVLKQRVLLDVQAGRIDVGAQYVHAPLNGHAAHHEGHEALVHPLAIHPIPRLQRLAGLDQRVQVAKARRPADALRLRRGLPLGLGIVQKRPIGVGEGGQPCPLLGGIVLPCVLSVHKYPSITDTDHRYAPSATSSRPRNPASARPPGPRSGVNG